jgi:hypothetical protein
MIPMQIARAVAAVAVGAGLGGDLLLRAVPWGLNFGLWVALCAAAAAWVTSSSRGTAWWREARWYAPALFFAACVAWRDAEQLLAWNVLGVGLALLLAALRAHVESLPATSLGAYLMEPIRTGLSCAIGPAVAATELMSRPDFAPLQRATPVWRIVVGLLLALPVVLVFGGLLAAADAVFERTVRWLLDWDFGSIASHLVVTAILAWVAAGYLLRLLDHGPPRRNAAKTPRGMTLGVIELGIPLGLLVLLFAIFVVIQAQYLFGGETLVRTTAGLSYADYARRGFFELIAVTGLLLPLLLAADWLVDRERAAPLRAFRILAGVLLALTLVIVASALERMRLYVDAYGLTVERLYALVVMIWAVLALGWFAATVMRRARHRFAFGAVVAGFAVLAALNVLNPEHVTVRVNLARADGGEELDVRYLLRLSADAVPTVLAELPARDVEVACADLERMQTRVIETTHGGRRWNLARARALAAVRSLDPEWAARCVADE